MENGTFTVDLDTIGELEQSISSVGKNLQAAGSELSSLDLPANCDIDIEQIASRIMELVELANDAEKAILDFKIALEVLKMQELKVVLGLLEWYEKDIDVMLNSGKLTDEQRKQIEDLKDEIEKIVELKEEYEKLKVDLELDINKLISFFEELQPGENKALEKSAMYEESFQEMIREWIASGFRWEDMADSDFVKYNGFQSIVEIGQKIIPKEAGDRTIQIYNQFAGKEILETLFEQNRDNFLTFYKLAMEVSFDAYARK